MRTDGPVARPKRRRRVNTTDSRPADPTAPNRLGRHLDVDGVALNRVWVGDTTHLPPRERFVYLATVLALGSCRCVGWAMRDARDTDLVVSALRMAQQARRPAPGLVLPSDRGSQYASTAYRAELTARGMPASMRAQGD
jgi:putative transposase